MPKPKQVHPQGRGRFQQTGHATSDHPITLAQYRKDEGLPPPEPRLLPADIRLERSTKQQARENRWGRSTFSLIKPR